MPVAAVKYQRRTPEKTALYDVLEKNLEAFRKDVHSKGKSLPSYVEEEFQAFFGCGKLENGFARIRCTDCGHEKFLPFSCKRRGFCPSCCGRRMNESEIRIAKEVFPSVPARQWVLSLPMPLRFFCARNRKLVNALVEVFYAVISRLIVKKLREQGIKNPKTGGILVVQRLGGSLNLNVHFHAIFLDGGYICDEETNSLQFHELGGLLTSEDVAKAVEQIAIKSFKVLENTGFLIGDVTVADDSEPDAVSLCDGASVKNMIAFGERAGQRVRRIKLNMDQQNASIRGDLVAEINHFNLKADKALKHHQRWKLARLVRYITRPPLAHERLSIADDGTVRYKMKKPWSDGTIEIQLSGVELVEKLAAAVPPPRGHLIRYFGVLGPNSSIRRKIVLVPKPKARGESGKLRASAAQRATWAELAKHTFNLDLTKCEKCGGAVRRIAVIRDPLVIDKILKHVGLAITQLPEMRTARPPPIMEFCYQTLPADLIAHPIM